MKGTIRLAIGLIAALALTLGLVSSAVAAPAESSGPPVVNKVVSVHYGDGPVANIAAQARPASSLKVKPLYVYKGIHWKDSGIPVPYVVDDRDNGDYLDGLQNSFEAWESDPLSHIAFECTNSNWTGIPSSFVGDGIRNGVDEVGWASLSSLYPNAIAVTMIWYGRDKHIVEVDTAMNTDLPWTQNAEISDPDEEFGAEGFFDVQDIMTHEAGHWLMLGDLYTDAASEQTMYGYGSTGELKARTLESGDIAGLRKIYPGA